MTVAAAAKIFAVAIPMVLVGVLHAPAQVLSSAQAPLGSITALQDAGQVGGKAPATPYALALKVTDTDKREIEAKASVRATPEGVDASPTPSDEGRTIWRRTRRSRPIPTAVGKPRRGKSHGWPAPTG